MFHSKRYRKKTEPLNVFPAFTDLMANAFMILSLFLLLALLQATELNRKLQSAAPIEIDEKSGNFTFPLGEAELPPKLRDYIRQKIIPDITETVANRSIDFIQVIGHTDGNPINRQGNLDLKLNNTTKVESLQAGSNADLGLMRALAVIQEIKKSGQVDGVQFRAYSAGQLYDRQGNLFISEQDDRRRIEIRFIPPGEKR
ncbi:MAG: hypothetical protein ACK5CA_10675 [Cyanobacteriota bacterium]|jgi:outer membrane protein OmpA-like peptidoglycan-associated protein